MAIFKIKTLDKIDIEKKPRVYFTCHPDDFDKYFKKVCEDIFKTHDCAIYYTEDMNEVIPEDEKQVDLGRNNLFVVPVTFKLLTTPNRAMDDDIPYAVQEHIAVLPIMMEHGIEEFYSDPHKFGELQYINPFSTDLTEISYEEKLKNYLESVLVSDETAKRIRAAFDTYIFLSYRKKDRKYANELMRLIHSIPECRDVAIWFDEFLTPGESFKDNISKMLNNSKLFALLVTPNLLEEPNGKPNFVMGEEYPAAKQSDIDILPAEMEYTDKAALETKFQGLPNCVNPYDNEAFKTRLLETITKLANQSSDMPEHNFLIGLAYLDGIDVEVDRERGVQLILSAAEAGLVEAMKKLCYIYRTGKGAKCDCKEEVKWAERIVDYYVQQCGNEHTDTLDALENLGFAYDDLGNYHKALQIKEQVYEQSCKVLGEKHLDTLSRLNSLVSVYDKFGYSGSQMWAKNFLYKKFGKFLGEKKLKETLSQWNAVTDYHDISDYRKPLELGEKAYTQLCEILGKEHPQTLHALRNLSNVYTGLGDFKKALQLAEEIYALACKIWDEEDPYMLPYLNNLAVLNGYVGDSQKELLLEEKVYKQACEIFGEDDFETIIFMNNLATTYDEIGEHQKALTLIDKAYTQSCKISGESHPNTITILGNMAGVHKELGNRKKELELRERVYELRCNVQGQEHPNTISALDCLMGATFKNWKFLKGAKLFAKYYKAVTRSLLGERK
ncbi:MAG: tetratricopeptide repeat protein [Clostridia bacterium]|nr:tetratricopeptide repeat protein [Clostridia bacterium]